MRGNRFTQSRKDAKDAKIQKPDPEKPTPDLEQLAATPVRKLRSVIAKRRKLIENLRGDLERHGNAERWKRYGELLLANVQTATREGDVITVTDYFEAKAPQVEIEGDAHKELSEIAEGYFRRYTKSRNAREVVAGRLAAAENEIADTEKQLREIDAAIERGDETFITSLIEEKKKPQPVSRKKKAEAAFKGARRFVSSDGLEILVGKKAVDNDFLTFRIAKSLDVWLHAADYPGSHVVIRSAGRKEIPQRTVLEAAQLAAFYSDARSLPTAAVNYTQKKHVGKPKRSAPGLVSLANFKTILVEPKVGAARKESAG